MLGSKKKDSPFYHGGTTLLAKSVEVLGDIKFSGTLEVEGKVVGNISPAEGQNAQINIRASGEVVGEVRAPRVMINGSVTGDVHAHKHLELAAKSIVNGNVHYQVIEMVKGAEVNGSLVHITDDDALAIDSTNTLSATPVSATQALKSESTDTKKPSSVKEPAEQKAAEKIQTASQPNPQKRTV